MRRTVYGLAMAMTAAALVSPSVASTAPRCGQARVAGPAPRADHTAEDRQRARLAPIVKVTDRNDEAHPAEVRYTHRPGFTAAHQAQVPTDLVYHTVQILPRAARTTLWIRVEFAEVATDIDLIAYSRHGARIGASTAANNVLADSVFRLAGYQDNGGPGYEAIDGLPVMRCSALTIETQSSLVVAETPVRLLMWLGAPSR